MSLAYVMDSPSELTLVGEGGACGTLKGNFKYILYFLKFLVNLIPTDKEGIKNLGEEMDESEETFEGRFY